MESGTGETTRQNLLDAAEQLFSEKGFADTPVRDITTKAGCNLASVNYHFGSKENLYKAVFQRVLTTLRELRLCAMEEVASQPDVDLEKVLYAFSWAFLHPLVDVTHRQRMMGLFMREMSWPLLPKSMLFEELIDPISRVLIEALRKQCPGLSESAADLCKHSLVGQLLHLLHAGKLYADAGQVNAPILDLHKAVDHIVRFTKAGIRDYAGEDGS